MNNIDILEEKEKKAIENLKGGYWYVGEEGLEESVKIVLNLVETLIAENKELKEENKKLTDEYMIQKHLINAEFLDDYILKSKVEEVIKEYKKKGNSVGIPHLYGTEIELLQSLLGKE